MQDLLSQCKSKGSPGHDQTDEGYFGEGLVRLSVNRVKVREKFREIHKKMSESEKLRENGIILQMSLKMLTLHFYFHILSKDKSYQCYFLLYR